MQEEVLPPSMFYFTFQKKKILCIEGPLRKHFRAESFKGLFACCFIIKETWDFV